MILENKPKQKNSRFKKIKKIKKENLKINSRGKNEK